MTYYIVGAIVFGGVVLCMFLMKDTDLAKYKKYGKKRK